MPRLQLVHVIYPEDRFVTPDVILGWAHDALVDAAVDDHVRNAGPISYDADGDLIYETIRLANPRPTDLKEAMAFLSDIGSHTFARR
jgi:hypothetical protein